MIRSVLAVDDDETVLARYERGFGPGRTVHRTTDPEAARRLVETTPCDLAIVELRIKNESGIDLARALKRVRPDLVVALCSGYLSVGIAVTAVRAGVDLVLFKPVTAREILRRIDQGSAYEPDLDETPTLECAEWEHISRVLADCSGNVSMAARRLGIYRSSLQRRLRKAGPHQVVCPPSTRRGRRGHGDSPAAAGVSRPDARNDGAAGGSRPEARTDGASGG